MNSTTRLKYRLLLLMAVCYGASTASAQDLETITTQKPITFGGGFSWNNTFYSASGMENRRDPYFWQFNANASFNILGVVDIPFSFTFSQQQKKFNQPRPFNRFGLSPTYKSWTLYGGYRSMSFSQFTLAGTLFLGGGVEYKPDKNPWRVSAMYGRLAKPVERVSSDGLVFAEPTFRRTGYGIKVGYEDGDFSSHLILFRAEDDPASIPITDSLSIRPQDNLVLGILWRFKLVEKVGLDIDFAHSMFTRDINAPENTLDRFTFVNNLGGLFHYNSSTTFTNALQSKMTFDGNLFQLNVGYRRIDPEFTTLGSSFLNNDLEDISGGISLPLFTGKLSMSANAGVQRNNLHNQLAARIVRAIFSSSVNVSFGERLSTSLSYSNFSTDTKRSLLQTELLSDTLEFFQITRNGTINTTYMLGASKQNSLFASASLQDAMDSEGSQSMFTNLNCGYSMALNQVWTINLSGSYNGNQTHESETRAFGPAVGLGRSLANKKIRTNLSWSFFSSYQDGELQNTIQNLRWSATSSIGKHQSISLNAFYINRTTETETVTEITELRGNINYAFRF